LNKIAVAQLIWNAIQNKAAAGNIVGKDELSEESVRHDDFSFGELAVSCFAVMLRMETFERRDHAVSEQIGATGIIEE
jgi:hypothetical protein